MRNTFTFGTKSLVNAHPSSSFRFADTTIETDFSGTTFTCAIIRNNHCTLCNIGDSRTSIAYRNKTGGVTAVNLTIDHKPDMPVEKVNSRLFTTLISRNVPLLIFLFFLFSYHLNRRG